MLFKLNILKLCLFLNESGSALTRANHLLYIKQILQTWILLNRLVHFVLRPVVRYVWKII